jgi:hypothetical protein
MTETLRAATRAGLTHEDFDEVRAGVTLVLPAMSTYATASQIRRVLRGERRHQLLQEGIQQRRA